MKITNKITVNSKNVKTIGAVTHTHTHTQYSLKDNNFGASYDVPNKDIYKNIKEGHETNVEICKANSHGFRALLLCI